MSRQHMSVRMMQIILVLAPLFLGLSIWAYFRLRRHVCDSPDPIVVFRRMRWNSLIIAFGGLQAIENLGAKQLLEFARGLGIV